MAYLRFKQTDENLKAEREEQLQRKGEEEEEVPNEENRVYDVCIVGAGSLFCLRFLSLRSAFQGPSGSTCAFYLARVRILFFLQVYSTFSEARQEGTLGQTRSARRQVAIRRAHT